MIALAAINQDNQKRALEYTKKSTMSEEKASELLIMAHANHRQVVV